MVLYVSNYKAKSKEKMQVLLLKLELNNKILIKVKIIVVIYSALNIKLLSDHFQEFRELREWI